MSAGWEELEGQSHLTLPIEPTGAYVVVVATGEPPRPLIAFGTYGSVEADLIRDKLRRLPGMEINTIEAVPVAATPLAIDMMGG